MVFMLQRPFASELNPLGAYKVFETLISRLLSETVLSLREKVYRSTRDTYIYRYIHSFERMVTCVPGGVPRASKVDTSRANNIYKEEDSTLCVSPSARNEASLPPSNPNRSPSPHTPFVFPDVKMVFGAKWADNKSLRKIPSSDVGIFEKCKKDAGFVPYFIRKMQHPAAKKAFAFGFLLRINQGSDEVSVTLKQVLFRSALEYVFGPFR